MGKLEVNIDVMILDAMFMIRTKPLPSHANFRSFAEYLFHNWVLYNAAPELHVVFDIQNPSIRFPKEIERSRRDKKQISTNSLPIEIINDSTPIRRGWQDFTADISNRRSLVFLILDSLSLA